MGVQVFKALVRNVARAEHAGALAAVAAAKAEAKRSDEEARAAERAEAAHARAEALAQRRGSAASLAAWCR